MVGSSRARYHVAFRYGYLVYIRRIYTHLVTNCSIYGSIEADWRKKEHLALHRGSTLTAR